VTGYVLSVDADLDLDDIWEYIARDNIDAADRWIAKLFDAFEALGRTPGMGHTRSTARTVSTLDFRHDLLNGGAFEPAMAIACIVAAPGSVHAEETCEAVQAQLPPQDSECMPLEFVVRHFFEGDRTLNSRYQDNGFSTLTRIAPA
jgi:plasmid stabilization system protein ParE